MGPSCQALLASDKRLYLAGSDTLFVYDLESGRQLAERGLPGIADLAFAQGGLAVACPGRLLLLDANTLMQSREIRLEDDARRLLATPAGLVVMTGSGGLLRLRLGGARDALPVPPEGIRDLAARGEDIWMIGRTGALYRAGSADSSPRKIRLRRPVRAF